MLPMITTTAFLALTLLPQLLMANISATQCVSSIQKTWPSLSTRTMIGESRHKTDCRLEMEISKDGLDFNAEGNPLQVQFLLGFKANSEQVISQCNVDNKKIHLVFEDSDSKVTVQLIKKQGVGWSLIALKKDMTKPFFTKQSSLFCGLK